MFVCGACQVLCLTRPVCLYRRSPDGILTVGGVLKKHALSLAEGAASGVPCLRRSGFAQAGRPLAVLTYSSVRSARPSGCGLSFEKPQDRAGRTFLYTPLGVWHESSLPNGGPMFASGGMNMRSGRCREKGGWGLFAGAIQAPMLTANPAGIFQGLAQGMTRSMQTDREVIRGDL